MITWNCFVYKKNLILDILRLKYCRLSSKMDYYTILGVQPTASSEEIKKAFKNQSLRNHPDKNQKPEAKTKMQDILAAYKVLSDPKERKEYDYQRSFGKNNNFGSHFHPPQFDEDDFNSFFFTFETTSGNQRPSDSNKSRRKRKNKNQKRSQRQQFNNDHHEHGSFRYFVIFCEEEKGRLTNIKDWIVNIIFELLEIVLLVLKIVVLLLLFPIVMILQ